MNTTQTQVPMPNNPAHIENLKSIALLKAQGFEGPDEGPEPSLRESIFEYGMAWRWLDNGELLIVHRNPSMLERFERTTYAADLDVQKEWNWVNWEAFIGWTGMQLTEWLAMPLPLKIRDLVNHYGELEIYGESYWEGFSIDDCE